MHTDSQTAPVMQDKLTEVLLEKKLLSHELLNKAITRAHQFQQTLFQHVMQHQLVSAEKLLQACHDHYQLPCMILDNKNADDLFFASLPTHISDGDLILPFFKDDKQLRIAISNPNDVDCVKKFTFQLGISIQLYFVRYDMAYRLHNNYVSKKIYQQTDHSQAHHAQRLTHQLLSDAIHRNASDIHFEPFQHYLSIRFRIDGLLHHIIQFPSHVIDTITSCVKVMAQMDIAIKRTPQDGRFTFHSYLGFFKDCRASSCPTIHGEKIVIRLLEANTKLRAIEDIGLKKTEEIIVRHATQAPQGLILVTGPTGSGKTITLYTLLSLLNKPYRNINTLEDPVEIYLDGINQTQIHHKNGLTFSQTLRALLRQDPDIMMIGEIRDHETAEIAVRAAQTGHLVLSTLHTNSAVEAVLRLSQMGVSPCHLSAALTLVIAQRLVRKLCTHCRIPKKSEHHDHSNQTAATFEANGCIHCSNGYYGRLGIFELMPITTAKKEMISKLASPAELAHQNKKEGHDDLRTSAHQAAHDGFTTDQEIYRVISNQAE